MFLCLWTWIPRQRPPVTAAAHSDVTHESTHVEADAVVKMSLPSPQDGRTDSTRCACRRGRQDGAILTEEGARQQGLTAYRHVPLNKIAVEMEKIGRAHV